MHTFCNHYSSVRPHLPSPSSETAFKLLIVFKLLYRLKSTSVPHCFSREKPSSSCPCRVLTPRDTPHTPPHALLPDTTKTKAIRLQAIASKERYRLLSMYKGSAGRGGAGWQCNTTLATTKPRPGLRARKTKQPPLHYHAPDPEAAQTIAQDTSSPGQESRCLLVVV